MLFAEGRGQWRADEVGFFDPHLLETMGAGGSHLSRKRYLLQGVSTSLWLDSGTPQMDEGVERWASMLVERFKEPTKIHPD